METFKCKLCGRDAPVRDGARDDMPDACALCWDKAHTEVDAYRAGDPKTAVARARSLSDGAVVLLKPSEQQAAGLEVTLKPDGSARIIQFALPEEARRRAELRREAGPDPDERADGRREGDL